MNPNCQLWSSRRSLVPDATSQFGHLPRDNKTATDSFAKSIIAGTNEAKPTAGLPFLDNASIM
jgi:hypothetical protein